MHRAALFLSILFAACSLARGAGFQVDVVAAADPDEFFTGLGQPYVAYGDQPTNLPGVPRTSYDFAWSITRSGDRLWMGNAGSIVCLGLTAHPQNPIVGTLSGATYRVCEGGVSQFPEIPPVLPDSLRKYVGDWRPPQVWCYNLGTGAKENRTPDDPLLRETMGLRAATATADLILLAGPDLYRSGINVFAFDARTRGYIGSRRIAEFSNIRQWVNVDGTLYAAVLNTRGATNGGSVIRWTGTPRNPFRFEVIGLLDNEGAAICAHEGRLFVTTWPDTPSMADAVTLRRIVRVAYKSYLRQRTPPAGLWMSPRIPSGGLHAQHAGQWKKIWSMTDYEPDAWVALSLAGGAVSSFEGWLYWGTMQAPGAGVETLSTVYGQATNSATVLANTLRPTALFRGRNFDRWPLKHQVQLLYGDTQMATYIEPRRGRPGGWTVVPNRCGPPLFGGAGFGNRYNVYAWSMAVHDGQLFVGTYDYSVILYGEDFVQGRPVPANLGADLYCFPSSAGPAAPVTLDGGGNPFNHGFRTMISADGSLYVGTVNSANLLTDPNDALPHGGWELLRVRGP